MPGPPDPDFELFLRNPHAILLKYQELFANVVQFYIERGMFPPDQKRDIVQTVNLELLEKIPTISEHYNGSALLRTYLVAIVRNTCIYLGDRARTPPIPQRSVTADDADKTLLTDRYSLEQAREIFRVILVQFGPVLPKLLICLKLRYRHPLDRRDILRWWPDCGNRELTRILAFFDGDYIKLRDREIYPLISPYFNAAEGKVSGTDSLRKWTQSKIEKILGLLEEAIPGSSFDEENMRILFEDYLSPFLLRE